MYKQSRDFFISIIIIVVLLLSGLFIYLLKIEDSMKYYDKYKNSLTNLRIIDKDFNNFFNEKEKFINFDEIVKKTYNFEDTFNTLKDSKISLEFGEIFDTKLDEINELYLEKLKLIEKFKSRQATILNSIHYLFDLNLTFQEDELLDLNLKNKLNNIIFILIQNYIGINNNNQILLLNLEYLKNYANGSNNDNLIYLYKHAKKVLEIKKESVEIYNESKLIKLENKINQTSNLLEKYHDNELFNQLIIALLFFVISIIMIIFLIKSYLSTIKIRNELQAFKYAVQHSDNSVVLTDANRKILYVNEIFESNSGYSKGEVLGNKPKVLQSGLTPQSRYEQLDKNLEKGQKWEGEFINRRKDGSIFYEKASIVPIFLDGKVINYLAIKLDITKYIKQQEELKESAIVFENTQEGILVTDSQGYILSVNKAYEDISGYTKKELIGTQPNILNSKLHDDKFYANVFASLNKKGIYKGKVLDKSKDGKTIPTWLNITAVKDNNGKIIKYISIHTNLQEIIDSQEKADYLEYHDSLTSLPNRFMLEEHLKHVIEISKRNNYEMALLFIDLDRFKMINDTLGHEIGDRLLKEVSLKIKSVLRQTDMLARMGGDEFVVVVESAKNKNSAAFICDKILEVVKTPIKIGKYKLNTSASIGVAMYPQDGEDITTLIKNADTAMYHAKKQGKDTFEYYDKQLSIDVHDQLQIEQELKKAILDNELYLNYQAQYDLKTGKTCSFEALVRWQSKLLGFVSPASFIPIAEDTGLIIDIGNFVFKKACEDFKKFKAIDNSLQFIAINVSSVQFRDENFIKNVKNIIKEVDINPNSIEIEITERYIMDFNDSTMNILNELKSLGFRMSIDDFGTGYSSMSYLTKLPVETIKVDKSFIDYIPNDNNNLQIAKAIIALAKSLGYKTIAEGIEYKEQEDVLKTLNCDIGQGYLFAKPKKYEDVIIDLQNL